MSIATLNFTLSYLFTGLILLGLAIFVYTKDRANNLNMRFAMYSLSIGWWSIFSIFMINAPSEGTALFWDKICLMGTVFIPSTFLHFIFTFLGYDEKRKNIIKANYFISLLFLLSLFATPFFAEYTEPKKYISHFTHPGFIYTIFVIYFVIVPFTGIYLLFAAMKREAKDIFRKQQLTYLFWTSLFGYVGGTFNYMLVYDMTNSYLASVGNYLIAIYGLAVAYIILRYRFLDIEVIIKKTLVFATLFIISFGIFVGITVLTQELLAGGRLLGLAISSIIIIFSVRPLEDHLIKITDKYLFQKKYDYKHLIRQFMDELRTMLLNAQDIAQSTLDFLNSSIHPANSAILIHNKFTNMYEMIASVDFKGKGFKIPDVASLSKELRVNAKIISIGKDNTIKDEEKQILKDCSIELAIPLIIHKDLIGIVLLGKKKSDEEYTEDDIDALSDLSGALTIAINNAQLFDERADAEKRAMIGTLATGINHEIGNPLNIINIRLQSFKILANQGLLEKKTKEEIIKEIANITDVCLESTQRISEITKKVSEFAKPDKTLVLDKVNVSEAIDDSVAILKHELALERVNFKKEIFCNSPHVLVDRGQLKQILFNLVKNAAQANDKKKGEITVQVNKHGKEEIVIKIIDNGPGIPKENLDRIFMPFYTTKEPGKGTGLGLALVNRLVERNNGKIEVQSQVDKGTTFTLIFKGICYE